MSEAILTLNAGSSSLKFAVFSLEEDHAAVLRGQVGGLGVAPGMSATDAAGAHLPGLVWPPTPVSHEAILGPLLSWIEAHLAGRRLKAVGHRIVHGGASFAEPVRLTEGVLTTLEALSPLAPLHQPHNLAAVRAAQTLRPGLPQIGCFDTAFHHGHSDVVTRFALPRSWHERGVRRYGFHGLSYEFVAQKLCELDPDLAAGRVIVAHLGNGASLCALRGGQSVDTTMGFTALDGLMMGTRCGALDPGVVLYLLQQAGLSVEAVQALLYEQSGLLGVSGVSSDMRVLAASADPKARDAIDLFTFRIAREAGALIAALRGLDGIVFTGGIGENEPVVRAAVADRLAWLGLALDPVANSLGAGRISAAGSRLRAWVIPTDEEAMIARHTAELIAGEPALARAVAVHD